MSQITILLHLIPKPHNNNSQVAGPALAFNCWQHCCCHFDIRASSARTLLMVAPPTSIVCCHLSRNLISKDVNSDLILMICKSESPAAKVWWIMKYVCSFLFQSAPAKQKALSRHHQLSNVKRVVYLECFCWRRVLPRYFFFCSRQVAPRQLGLEKNEWIEMQL